MPISTRPATSMPRCRPTLCRSWWTTGSCRQDRRRRAGTAAAAVSGEAVSGEAVSREAVAISVPHPGVDERGDDVDDEVGDRDDHRQQGDDALDGDEVAGLQVLEELEAQPLPLER